MISKNTLYVHIPQHLIFGTALVAMILGYFSFWWLLVTYLGWIVLGYFGFSVWYHRYFAHRAFRTYRVWEYVWGYLGLLVGRGSPLNLASLHCGEHHPYADTDKDPHSPNKGKMHSWFMWSETYVFKLSKSATKHLIRDGFIRFLDRNYLRIFWTSFFVLCLISIPFACFCMMGAGVLHFHIEGAVSTYCHLPEYGVQDFVTGDNSRNIRGLFNIFTLGTGLHNNHHARPASYHYALLPGDFDLAKYTVPLFIKEA